MLCPIWFQSCRGQKKEAAFAAATVYLSLISLPGKLLPRLFSDCKAIPFSSSSNSTAAPYSW